MTLAECQTICDGMEELKEGGDGKLFLTEELEEYKARPDDGEILVVTWALSGLVAPRNKRTPFFRLDA